VAVWPGVRDNIRDNIRGVQCVRGLFTAGRISLYNVLCDEREALSQVEGLVRDNRVEVRVLFGA
jgi:hypothetical protein